MGFVSAAPESTRRALAPRADRGGPRRPSSLPVLLLDKHPRDDEADDQRDDVRSSPSGTATCSGSRADGVEGVDQDRTSDEVHGRAMRRGLRGCTRCAAGGSLARLGVLPAHAAATPSSEALRRRRSLRVEASSAVRGVVRTGALLCFWRPRLAAADEHHLSFSSALAPSIRTQRDALRDCYSCALEPRERSYEAASLSKA